MEILFLSRNMELAFLCLGSCRIETQVSALILEVRHVTVPVESFLTWNMWQRKEMSAEKRLDLRGH